MKKISLATIILSVLLSSCAATPSTEEGFVIPAETLRQAELQKLKDENTLLKKKLHKREAEGLSNFQYMSEPSTVEGSVVPYTFTFDPNEWEYRTFVDGLASEYQFKHKTKDIQGVFIPESTNYGINNFEALVQRQMDQGTQEHQVLASFDQEINGTTFRYMEARTMNFGNTLVNRFVLYSGQQGSLQVILYAPGSKADLYSEDMLKFFKGLTINQEQTVIWENE